MHWIQFSSDPMDSAFYADAEKAMDVVIDYAIRAIRRILERNPERTLETVEVAEYSTAILRLYDRPTRATSELKYVATYCIGNIWEYMCRKKYSWAAVQENPALLRGCILQIHGAGSGRRATS